MDFDLDVLNERFSQKVMNDIKRDYKLYVSNSLPNKDSGHSSYISLAGLNGLEYPTFNQNLLFKCEKCFEDLLSTQLVKSMTKFRLEQDYDRDNTYIDKVFRKPEQRIQLENGCNARKKCYQNNTTEQCPRTAGFDP